MSIEALEARIPFQLGRGKKNSAGRRVEVPKPFVIQTEPHAAHVYVIGDLTAEVDAQARKIGAETTRSWFTSTAADQKAAREQETGKRKRGKGRVRHLVNKSILHTFEESHRQRITRQAAEAIAENQNLQTVVQVPRIRTKRVTATHIDSESRRLEHEADQDAKTNQIETQYKSGINLGSQKNGRTVIKLNPYSHVFTDLVETIIKPIVMEDPSFPLNADPSLARRELEKKVLTILQANASNRDVRHIFGEDGYRMVATNVLKIAQEQRAHKDAYASGARALEEDIDIVLADLQSGARTGVSNSWVDKIVNTLQTKLGGVVSPGFFATGSAATILLSQRGVGNLLRATKDTTYVLPELLGNGLPMYLAVPAAIAGGIAAFRHRREENIDKELHGRQDAQGEEISNAGTRRQKKRREKLQTFMHHEDTTAEALITGLNRDGGSLGNLRDDLTFARTTKTYTLILDRLSEIYARRNLSDRAHKKKPNVDTIKAGPTQTMDQGDELLTAEIAATLATLRTHYTEDTLLTDLTNNIQTWEEKLQKGINKKERTFKRRAWARSAGVGVVTTASAIAIGSSIRYGIQAIQTLPSTVSGVWEGMESFVKEKVLSQSPLFKPKEPTSAPSLAPTQEPAPAPINEPKKVIKIIPGEPKLVDHNAWATGHTTSVEDGWYENNTPAKSDGNEVKANNQRVGEKAVRWTIPDMTNHGSFSDDDTPKVARVKELIKKDAIYYRLYDPDIPADRPGGLNKPIIIKSNVAGGGMELDQQAGKEKLVKIWKDRSFTTVPENQLAKYTFSSDLGEFKANSDFTNFEDKFNVKVSPGTLRMINGEYVFQSFATIDGDGKGEAIEVPTKVIEQEVEPPQDKPVEPQKPAVPPTEQPDTDPEPTASPVELIDFGIPLPIAPRLAPGPMILISRTRIHPVAPNPATLPGYPGPLPAPAVPPSAPPAVLIGPAMPTGFVRLGATKKPDGPQPTPVILKPNSPEKKLSKQELSALSDDDFLKLLNGLVMIDAYGLERYLQQNTVALEGGVRYYHIIDHKGMTERFTLDELRALYLRGDIRLEAKK